MRKGFLKRLLELPQRLCTVRVRSAGLRIGDIIGVREIRKRELVVGFQLMESDQLELTVVEDDPYHRNFVLHGSEQLEPGHQVAPVATARHDDSVRMSYFYANGPICVTGHRAK